MMVTIFKKFDKMYGGYDYVEVNYEDKTVLQGNSRSHSGHNGTSQLSVSVATKKDLKQIKEDLINFHGFEMI